MPLQVYVHASFEASDRKEADKAVKKMKFPAGTMVSTSVHEQIEEGSGVAAEDGTIQAPPAPAEEPLEPAPPEPTQLPAEEET